jgi:hypothetical protein
MISRAVFGGSVGDVLILQPGYVATVRRGAAADDGEHALGRKPGTTTGTMDGGRFLHAVEAKADALHHQEGVRLSGRIEELAQFAIRIDGDGQRFVRQGEAMAPF